MADAQHDTQPGCKAREEAPPTSARQDVHSVDDPLNVPYSPFEQPLWTSPPEAIASSSRQPGHDGPDPCGRPPAPIPVDEHGVRSRSWLRLAGSTPPLRRHGRTRYLRALLAHRGHLFALGTIATAALMSGSAWMLLAVGVVEAAIVAVVPKLAAFQREVDRDENRAEQEAAAEARDALLRRMDPRHRQELQELEQLARRIRNADDHPEGSLQGVIDQELRLDRLLQSYVRLALRYKRASDALVMTDRNALGLEIRELENEDDTSASSHRQELGRRRLYVARRRAEWWDRNQEALTAIAHQLATVRDLVHLLHEQSMAPFAVETPTDDVERLVHDVEAHEQALQEIGDLDSPPHLPRGA